jgi:hypothetical protein
VVFTRNGGTGMIYVNGVLAGTNNNMGGNVTSGNLLRIGYPVSSEYYFQSFIDDVRIYNRALSAAEIAAMYNGGK